MSTVVFRVEDGKLFIDDRWVELPYAVDEILECGNSLVIRVEPPVGSIFNRNVFAVTSQGDVLWQIAESPHGTQADKPYVGIAHDKDGGLVAANWNGVDYSVDMRCGAITTKAFNK